jgi:Glycosyl transferase family 2
MSPIEIPPNIEQLAEARADARRRRDWATADVLKERIERAGWRVVDAGTLYTIERSAPPDTIVDGIVRYGSSRAVPSRLEEAPVGVATVVLVATDWPEDLARAMRPLVDHAPDGTQLVVVANAPSEAQAADLDGLDATDPGAPGIVTEVVWTNRRTGVAEALNAGLRRAAAPAVIILDPALEPRGDLVATLVEVLADPTVAVAGPIGLVSRDLRRFTEAPAGVRDVVAIGGDAMAFRRADFVNRGPLDEHFAIWPSLDVWWSLVLRDGDMAGNAPPRRAVQAGDVAVHHERRRPSLPEPERERLARRGFYRVVKRFGARRDLLVDGGTQRGGIPTDAAQIGR